MRRAYCFMDMPGKRMGAGCLRLAGPYWPLVLAGWLLCVPAARAQSEPGLVVQLPTFSVFSVQTTVSAPDSGVAFVGGLGHAASGYASVGPPLLPWAQRAGGQARRYQSLVVRAAVHDLEALDEAVLEQAARMALARETGDARGARGGSTADRPVASLAELRRRKEALLAAQQRQAQAMYERGKEALGGGQVHTARAWFRMAAYRARGALRAEILDQLELLAVDLAGTARR